MEEQVLELLRATQLSAAEPRMAAELQLKQLHENESFSVAMVTIGAHTDIPTADRLAALVTLKNFVNTAWSPALEDFAGKVLVNDQAKSGIRRTLLSIIYGVQSVQETKVVSSTAAVVAAIASSDFPEEWPDLLDSLLNQLPQSNDDQTQSILVVLGELVEGGLDEDAFYRYAERLFGCLHEVAVNSSKRLMVRAHAVNIFRTGLDFLENLKDKEESGIRSFADSICHAWSHFFIEVVREALPAFPSQSQEEDSSNPDIAVTWRGIVALKIQVILALARIQGIYSDLMPAGDFFTACWDSIQAHGDPYYASYVEGERQGGLINQYQLSYTLDFLVIEEIDYLQSLLSAPQVKAKLDEMDDGGLRTWMSSVLATLVAFSSITNEAEQMWELNVNTFLSEESFSEVNNSPRSVCASFVWKISGWFPQQTLASLRDYAQLIFHDSNSSWKQKEATLFTIQQVAEEFKSESRSADSSAVSVFLEIMRGLLSTDQPFLRARAYSAMAFTLSAWMDGSGLGEDLAVAHAQQALHALDSNSSFIVKAACIRVLHIYLTSLPSPQGTSLQGPIISSIAKFLDTQDLDDMDENIDLVDLILQTLRDTMLANPLTCLDHNGLDMLLMMVRYGAARDFRSSEIIEEAFESTASAMAGQGRDAYASLCHKILPSLVAAFDIEDPATKKKTTLTDVAAGILKILAEHAVDSLPPGFVAAAMPRLCRLIFADTDIYLSQTATLTIKFMLTNDKDQVLSYVDPEHHKTGLEMCFLVIGHLLGPQVEDVSAAEVGELASSVVEKAGPAALGSSMHELLQILVERLATAEHLSLIQSLISVFARLTLLNAAELIEYLAGLVVASKQTSGLAIVLARWLENASNFAGFEAVRESSTALATIYRANDPRVATIEVNGDLIPDTSSRIKTRSMAKNAPIRYTRVSAPLKLIKVLIAELLPYGDPSSALPLRSPGLPSHGAKTLGAGRNEAGGSDDEWESENDDADDAFGSGQRADDATQEFLVQFFREEGADPRLQELYGQLTEEEKKRCMDAVEGWGKREAQRNALGH